MGTLMQQTIATLFQGVSRQPDTVRLSGQVEEATNVALSVITGGAEKRAGSQHMATLASLSGSDYSVHAYERDSSESYFVAIEDGGLFVFDATTGDEKTVSFPDGKGYLASTDADNGFSFVTIADYTIIVNREVTAAMDDTFTPGTITGTKQSFSDLPTGSTGEIYRITGKDTDKFSGYLVEKRADGTWTETADPTIANAFDATTMPHELVRNGDGTFTFQQITWSDREVGDIEIVPDPDFIGRKIKDVVFFRDRLCLLADETIYASQVGDYFNMWPDKAIDILDSDPFGRTASTNQVNILAFAAAFRRSLFVTSDKSQFELAGGDILTPKNAVFEPTTNYKASSLCRPYALGDTLYFAADSGNDAVVYEYFYDDTTLSNTAVDVTKHVLGYVPGSLIQFTGDTTVGALFALTSADRTAVYTYRVFWEADEKKQSAWAKWTFGTDAVILAAYVIDGFLRMIIQRGDDVFMEKVLVADEFGDETSTFSITQTQEEGMVYWPTRLDRRVAATGTYSSGDGWTTWTVPYTHDDDVAVILSDDFTGSGDKLTVTYPSSTTVRALGDYSAGDAILGVPYEAVLDLSKQYPRDQTDNSTITTGRYQLKRIYIDYKNSGYFEIHITPRFRDTQVYTFNGRILGDGNNIIDQAPIVPLGVFKARVGSKASTVKIAVKSSSHLPFTITSAEIVGFFNELARQERSS